MEQQVTNFRRFYAALRATSIIGDREGAKRLIVMQYTNGRTGSLREMTRREYDRCCSDLEGRSHYKETLRKERSATLKLIQKLGIDTTDWAQINDFCRNPKIAGKEFARITLEEHGELQTKLRSIKRKGWHSGSRQRDEGKQQTRFVLIDVGSQRPEWN